MSIRENTEDYAAWLESRGLKLVTKDLVQGKSCKYEKMAKSPFEFLRATFYQWARTCHQLRENAEGKSHWTNAPLVLSVGDVHVENFGTWRDAEGRLVWGVNDFDEAEEMPYTNDLVRLATSASFALQTLEKERKKDGNSSPVIPFSTAAAEILRGYREGVTDDGPEPRPFVLAEKCDWLRDIAVSRLAARSRKGEDAFTAFLNDLEEDLSDPDEELRSDEATQLLEEALTRTTGGWIPFKLKHRAAGLGSRGRRRFVALGKWHDAAIVREVKELAPSAWWWAEGKQDLKRIRYNDILNHPLRCPDPTVFVRGKWVVRRLMADADKIKLSELPDQGLDRIFHAMGQELGQIHHAGWKSRREIRQHLDEQSQAGWLEEAALEMVRQTEEDHQEWRNYWVNTAEHQAIEREEQKKKERG